MLYFISKNNFNTWCFLIVFLFYLWYHLYIKQQEDGTMSFNDNDMSNKIRNIAKRKANPITSKEEKLLNEFIKFNEVKGKEILKKLKLIYKIK